MGEIKEESQKKNKPKKEKNQNSEAKKFYQQNTVRICDRMIPKNTNNNREAQHNKAHPT